MIKDRTRRLREQVFYRSMFDDVVIDVDLLILIKVLLMLIKASESVAKCLTCRLLVMLILMLIWMLTFKSDVDVN